MPVCLVGLFKRAGFAETATRVRDENIDRPECVLDLTAQFLDVSKLGDICDNPSVLR